MSCQAQRIKCSSEIEDEPIPFRVDSHLYCSISVLKSPREMVNLLLSSCRRERGRSVRLRALGCCAKEPESNWWTLTSMAISYAFCSLRVSAFRFSSSMSILREMSS